MRINATQLRADIYRLLDAVLESGTPLEIERNGKLLRIVAEQPVKIDRLAKLPRRKGAIKGNAEDLVKLDVAKGWKPDFP